MIRVANLQKLRVPVAKARRLARSILASEGASGELSLAFVDDRRMRDLNRRHLRHDYATDVLAFPLDGMIGEVVISADTAARESKERGIPYEEELLRYVAHGTLHLLGYDDHSPRRRKEMWERQEGYLKRGRSRKSAKSV